MARKQSRHQRWMAAHAEAQAALEEIQGIAEGRLAEALDAIREVQEEYREWRDNMPEGLDQSATAEKLDAMVDLDLDVEVDWSEMESILGEVESVDPPLGFGRD